MAKTDRGTKRQCLKCATKFYDLNNDPILCPSCGTQFMLVAQQETVEDSVVKAKSKKTDQTDSDEVEQEDAAVEAGAEVVSFDDVEEDDDKDDDEDIIADVDDDVEDIGGEVDNSFIEDDDEDDEDFGIAVSRDDDED